MPDGHFKATMKDGGTREKGSSAASRATWLTEETVSFPPHWAPTAPLAHGVNRTLKMPYVFKVRIGDAEHPENAKEFVGMADSSEQAVEFALSMASDCQSPLVFSVERISVLDI